MDLVERYTHAVGFWLPRAQRQDIIAELSEDIRSQIDEQERERGRELDDAEIAALLKARGNPVVVATRYLPERHLVGPTLFPIYLFVLKIVAACYLAPWILVWIGLVAYDPAFRASHGDGSWLKALGSFWGSFWFVGFVAIGVVTLVFAVLERTAAGQEIAGRWDPRMLPAVRDPNRISRGSSVAELAANIVFCAWWVAVASSPVLLDRPGARIVLAPAWPYFFWAYLALSVVNLAQAGVNLMRPSWTMRRAALRLATDIAGTAIFGVLCGSHIVAELSIGNVPTARSQAIAHAVNTGLARAIPYVVIVGIVVFAFDVRRMRRVSEGAAPGRTALARSGQD